MNLSRGPLTLLFEDWRFDEVAFLFRPGEAGYTFDDTIVHRNDDLRRVGKCRLAARAGKCFVFVREVGFAIGMRVIEGLQSTARTLRLFDDRLELHWIHRVGNGARVD